MKRCIILLAVAVVVAVFAGGLATAAEGQQTDYEQLARDMYAELIALRSTADMPGNVKAAAEAMQRRLIDAGFPREDVHIVSPHPELGNLVARFRGQAPGGGSPTKAPVMLMAHLDVVDALRSDWDFDPFELREIDGYFYGRGTDDNKAGAVHIVVNFIRLLEEGYVPDRDLIAVLTGDEETSSDGIKYLVRERRDLVGAAFAINADAGGGELLDGEPNIFNVQAAEKIYVTFHLTATNAGGHSSRPRPDNAIYELTMALARLSEFTFPVDVGEVARLYFGRSAAFNDGQTAVDMRAVAQDPPDLEAAARLSANSPFFNAVLHTTCVATRLAAGHADNALPQTAQATVNCRVLPGQNPDDIEATLRQVIGNDDIEVARLSTPTASDPSPLNDEIMGVLEPIVEDMWPGVPIIPTMSTGATDGNYARNAGIPVYGVAAIFGDPNDSRAHGQNERVGIKEFYDAQEFWYRMLKRLSGGDGSGPAATATAPHNWPQFRGPGALPVSDNPGLPSTWSTTENVEWVTDIAGVGWSSPIVWDGKVFVTAAISEGEMKQPSLGVDFSNDYVAELSAQGLSAEEVNRLVDARDAEFPDEVALQYVLYSIDLESGEILWQKPFHQGRPPVGRHRKNSYTSETPVTDGEAIYVYVAFMGLFAFDFDGNQLWNTPLDPHPVYLEFGAGASPALHGDRIFVLNDNEEASFVAAFDKNTGERLWYTPREGLGSRRASSAWSTPFVWENELRTEVVTIGPGWVISYDLDGDELWRMSRFSMMPIQSPFAWNGRLYVTSGVAGEQNKPIAAIRPGGSGDITPADDADQGEYVAWYNRVAGGTYLPTPLIYGGGLYVLSDTGIFSKYDPDTGERLYRARIHPQARNFTASPWAYDGKIFVLNEEGDTFVIKAGERFEFLGINSLDEFSMATPAISGDRLLIRTQGKLYSIRDLESGR